MLNASICVILIKTIGRSDYFINEEIGSEKLRNIPKDKHLVTGSRNSSRSLYPLSCSSFPGSLLQY